jgi:chemotaxis protein methyltransferase CheR
VGQPLRKEQDGTSFSGRGLTDGDRPSIGGNLTGREFEKIRDLLQSICGINLQHGKEELVKARLWKRIAALNLDSFEQYIQYVMRPEAGKNELLLMVDALTTNKTSFFREEPHFAFLRKEVSGWFDGNNALRIWSAGCSSGEEPYTIAMTLCEGVPGIMHHRLDLRILATDISARMLETARAGRYPSSRLVEVPAELRQRYFVSPGGGVNTDETRVCDPIRRLIHFARLNLLGPWPMRGHFDFVFCRNVMIYFDRETQDMLIERFRKILRPGGYLLVGHSESLTGKSDGLTYVMPAVYKKPA